MSYYNPQDYETTHERIARFYDLYPDGRILTEMVSDPANFEVCRYKASIYRRYGDSQPASTGFAVEQRDTEMKKSKTGQEYADVNYDSWEENAETSAIGRALANLGLSGAKRPTKEEISKVTRRPAPPTNPPEPEKPSNNGNNNKSVPVPSLQVPDAPPNGSTIQKVEFLLKRINQSEDISGLKQLAREIQFLNPRLNQNQKVVLKDCYFASLKRLEEQAMASTSAQ